MSRKIIACDLDDVLWDLVPTWIGEYNRIFKPKQNLKKEDITTWDFSNVFPNKLDAHIFYHMLTYPGFWDKVVSNQDNKVIHKNIIWVHELTKKYNVYVTTHTAYYQRHKIDLFLQLYKNYIDPNKLVLISDKWLLNADIVIDDKAETLQEFLKKGVRCVKINQPWNSWLDCESYDTFVQAAEKLMTEV